MAVRTSLVLIVTAANVLLFLFVSLLIYASGPSQYINITYLSLHEDSKQRNRVHSIQPFKSTVDEDSDICVCNRSDIKVFNLGLMKAGSVSFARVIRKFGCRSLHHGLHIGRGQDPFVNVTRWRTATMRQRRSTNKGNSAHIIPRVMMLAETNGHPLLYYFEDDVNSFSQLDDAAQSRPLFAQMTHFDVLHQQYPGAKFILMKRNITNHIASINKWGNLRQRLTKGNVPYLPKGKGKTDEELRAWIESHYRRVHDYFTRFAPDQYLEIQLEDDDDDKITAIRQFLHCHHRNFSMVHGNHNNATGVALASDRHHYTYTKRQKLIKYHRFKVEMGFHRKRRHRRVSNTSSDVNNVNDTTSILNDTTPLPMDLVSTFEKVDIASNEGHQETEAMETTKKFQIRNIDDINKSEASTGGSDAV